MELTKLKLLSSKPIKTDICSVHHTTIDEIDDVTESLYNRYLNILLFNKSDIYENEEVDESITEYEITLINVLHSFEFENDILSALSFFIKEKVGCFHEDNYAIFYIGNIKDGRFISKEIYFEIRDIVRQLNCIEKTTKKAKAGNKLAEDFIKEMEVLKNKYKKATDEKNVVTIADLVSAITWKGNKNYDEVFNFTIYRLYDALKQINTIDNHTFTMNGIYAGTIDASKMKTKLEKLNWIKG